MNAPPTPPNDSTEGITAGLQNVTDDNGAVRFHAPKDFVLPDLPRDVRGIATTGEFAVTTVSFT